MSEERILPGQSKHIQKEKKKMDTEFQVFFSKRKEEVQQQIKAQEQTVARETEVNNRCVGMEKTVKDAQDKNHKYELELCEKRCELRELKLQCEVQAAQSSQSRAEDEPETTKEKLRLEEERTKEAADKILKQCEASLETSIAHRNEVEQLRKQLTRIDDSLQQISKILVALRR
jgi:hypothetical protein